VKERIVWFIGSSVSYWRKYIRNNIEARL